MLVAALVACAPQAVSPVDEPQTGSGDTMNFNLENDFDTVKGLMLEAVGIAMVSAEEIERFEGSAIVALLVKDADDRFYRVSLFEKEVYSIWDVRDEETREYIYRSYEDSMDVLREVIDRNDRSLRSTMSMLRRAGITEVVHAEVREKENEELTGSGWIEIRTGDDKRYLLWHHRGSVDAIQDLDTEEFVFKLIR
jgi:hypothetical protein